MMQPDHATNSLRNTNVIHGAHEDHRLKTRDVDTFRQNAVVKNNKLFVVVFAPGTQSIKEHLTVHFLTINHTTSLGTDIHVRITTILKLIDEIGLRNKISDLLNCLGTNQNLTFTVLIDSIQKILTVTLSNLLTFCKHRKLLDMNLRRNNETTFNQFRCRNLTDYLTINTAIIHPRFGNSSRMLRSSSEEVAAVSSSSKMLCGREEMALNRIVCLIKVNGVNPNICLLQTVQGVISGEDQFVFGSIRIKCTSHNFIPVQNLRGFCSAEVMSFAAVNVKNCSVSDKLKKLRRELLCQKNTRCNYNNGLGSFRPQLTQSIKDHIQSLTSTRRFNDLTLRILLHLGINAQLVGAELNHRSHCVWNYYSRKGAPAGARVTVLRLSQIAQET